MNATKTALTEYRFTFGVQYPRVEHPTFPAAHRDGWLTVLATSREEARALAQALIGHEYAFDYAVGEMAPEDWRRHHPLGALHVITSTPVGAAS